MLEDYQQVLDAKTATELFGTHEKRSKIIYRRLARAVHPDLAIDSHKAKAQEAFAKLTLFWDTYQTRNNTPANPTAKNVIKTKKHEYLLGDVVSDNGIFQKYAATYDAGYKKCMLLITKNPKDSDLSASYVTSLKKIHSDAPEQYRSFFPEFMETFRYRAEGNTDYSIIVQKLPDGMSPFSKILEVYPNGISGKDVGWIFRRMLIAVGNAHDVGLIHGGVNLDSLWIHPEGHGVVLSDWQYSVESGNPMSAIASSYRDDYPQYVFDKKEVNYALDIHLCAKTALKLLGKNEPRQFNAFFKACMLTNPLKAKNLLHEFELLLERLYGPPEFHPFTLNP